MPELGSKQSNKSTLEAAKRTTAKAAAAAVVITMAANVALDTQAGFAAAQANALDLAKRYGELASARLP